jgi:ergothioneine biosynthesis protein EgtB
LSTIEVEHTAITSKKFLQIRQRTEALCKSLKAEDVSCQPVEFVSPPKWHMAHTTWFFEQFVLVPHYQDYKVYNKDYAYFFNSYYNNVGPRVLRHKRGLMTRPTLNEVLAYRSYVNEHMQKFIEASIPEDITKTIEIGLQHEQQHQELLIYDIKYLFGHQPAYPTLDFEIELKIEEQKFNLISIPEGLYDIGYSGNGFCWDNELGQHKRYLHNYEIANRLVTNAEYLEFIKSGGYDDFNLWHADGWDYIKSNNIEAPLYWHQDDNHWRHYTLNHGLVDLEPNAPVCHISFYEAFAFSQWSGIRLPTEFEWEVASPSFNHGQLWEWTNSAYLPYPNYAKADGALGEYNGKFMVNQMVLRGGSVASSPNHVRKTYRNFFHPEMRWLFSGIRLAK